MADEKEDLFKSGNDDVENRGNKDGKKEGLLTVLGREIKYRISVEIKPKYDYKLRTKIISYVVVGLALVFIIAAIIAAQREKQTVALIFAGAFTVTIVGYMAAVFIMQRRHLRLPKGGEIKREAKVLGCALSSTTSFGRSVKCVYRVKLDIDGKEYESFSRQVLREGRRVTVLTADDPNKYCFIVPDGEGEGAGVIENKG